MSVPNSQVILGSATSEWTQETDGPESFDTLDAPGGEHGGSHRSVSQRVARMVGVERDVVPPVPWGETLLSFAQGWGPLLATAAVLGAALSTFIGMMQAS